MSTLGNVINNTCRPVPPREWNRFENLCAYFLPDDANPNPVVYIPLLRKNVTSAEAAYLFQIYKKGNVLQYKSNSANLTNQQRYAQIAKGMWTNRTTTWATQSDTYSNPNTQSLKRLNYVTIPLNAGDTGSSETLCPPLPVTPQYNVLPDTATTTPGTEEPPIIPPPEEPPAGETGTVMPPYAAPAEPEPIVVVPDGGNLLCNQVEDICSGTIVKELSGITECTPSSASNVPGEEILLCWNDGDQTYYPRQRLTYGTSGDKWPVNNKVWGTNLCQTAPVPPNVPFDLVLITASPGNNLLYLVWNANNAGSEIITFTFIIERVGDLSEPIIVTFTTNSPQPFNNLLGLLWSANNGGDPIDNFTFTVDGPN